MTDYTDLDRLTAGAGAEPRRTHRTILVDYLRMKVDECDWHAVADAANDLRVLEARTPPGDPRP